jgi:hypothetical protein
MVRLGDGTSKEAFGPEATMAPALSPRALGSRAKGDLPRSPPWPEGVGYPPGRARGPPANRGLAARRGLAQVQGLANACFVMTLGAETLALLHHLRYVIL